MSDTIDSAALHVAETEHKLDEANGKLAAAQRAADDINGRIAALEAERAEIISAARAGDADGKLGLRLAVLTADGVDIRKIAVDAQAGVANARAEVNRAAQQVAIAEQGLAAAKDAEAERQLVEYVNELATKLGAGVAELRAIWSRKRARPVWAPTTELLRELQSLRFIADRRQSDGISPASRRSAA